MKPHYHRVPANAQDAFTARHDITRNLNSIWHYHPQLELHCVVRGEGVRFIGDAINNFSPGEIILLGESLPILRYSDVLLLYAETLNELGRTSEALPFVQQVRNRAGLLSPLTGLDKITLQTLIAKERQVEFCFENQRWYDLKRTGKALEVMNDHGKREKAFKSFLYPEAYTLQANKLLAPIPSVELSVNKLEQNPGY